MLLISCAGDVNSDLINAAAKGQAEPVEALLAKGADVNAKGKGDRTALIFAAVSGHADAARVLLDHGADLHVKGGVNLDHFGGAKVDQLVKG